jgi:hypothetical protein
MEERAQIVQVSLLIEEIFLRSEVSVIPWRYEGECHLQATLHFPWLCVKNHHQVYWGREDLKQSHDQIFQISRNRLSCIKISLNTSYRNRQSDAFISLGVPEAKASATTTTPTTATEPGPGNRLMSEPKMINDQEMTQSSSHFLSPNIRVWCATNNSPADSSTRSQRLWLRNLKYPLPGGSCILSLCSFNCATN